MNAFLNKVGSLTSEIGAEINAFDAASQKLFIVSGDPELQIIDLSDPSNPTAGSVVDLSDFGNGINSVAVKDGVVAVAVENTVENDAGDEISQPGQILFLDTAGNVLNTVTVGFLPDMVTFTPNGAQVLVANEGEPDDVGNPEGSISIIDLSAGVAGLTQADVTHLDFTAFDGQEADLRADGVRIFPNTPFSQDAEPEYIAVSPDGTQAFVTLQENNAIAVVDLATKTIKGIQPLGLKDFSKGLPELTTYDITDRGAITNGGDPLVTADGQTIELGGFSGLWFDGVADNGNLKFLAVPDRGPNGDPLDLDGNGSTESRAFLLPDYQSRVVSLELNETTGAVSITDELFLTQADGTPITGLPNIPNDDRQAVDAFNNPVDLPELTQLDAASFGADYDPFGADLEGIVRANDGTFWMVDEYRPAVYHFTATGELINRLVPQGTVAAANADNPGANFGAETFGIETLPAEYLNRRRNRGFEAVALDAAAGILYAFIQTPLSNPNRAAGDDSQVIRVLAIDTANNQPTAEYVYLLQDPKFGNNVDKIGDAVYAGEGKFFVMERDSALDSTAQKFIFEVDITGATNVLDFDFGSETLEQQTPDDLANAGITTLNKVKVTNLPSIGYLPSDKPEGLALLEDGRLAVLNDNDFGLEPGAEAVQLGIISFTGSNGLDASDRDENLDNGDLKDGINIDYEPVYGFFMPDSIAAYEANGINYYITANEGDDRGDADEDEFGDAIRIKDLEDVTSFGRNGLALDERFDPAIAEDDQLGRLTISSLDGDLDGDGDLDQLISYSARSFSIWDENGNQVFDSGDQIAQITAALTPDLFNANDGDRDEFDNRSDNKGAEPEAVTVGQVSDRTFAFVGLERAGGGVLVYDVTNPFSPEFLQYARADEDIAPEGLTFISGDASPDGQSLLVVTNEESASVAVYEIDLDGTDDFVKGTADNDILSAGAGDDRVVGKAGDDLIFGNSGDDALIGDAGNDTLFGGAGRDRLVGKAGDDLLFGGADNDQLIGDRGNDFLDGGLGNDKLVGGQGSDTFVLTAGEGTDRIQDFQLGIDVIGLADGLTFEDLSFERKSILFGDERLATFNGALDVRTLTVDDFTAV